MSHPLIGQGNTEIKYNVHLALEELTDRATVTYIINYSAMWEFCDREKFKGRGQENRLEGSGGRECGINTFCGSCNAGLILKGEMELSGAQ